MRKVFRKTNPSSRLWLKISALSLLLLSSSALTNEPDWNQERALGQDISSSHGGARWFVGQDGAAYRWQADQWVATGGPRDLTRIDASEEIAVAVSESGQVWLYRDNSWQSLPVRASDAGIGGGQIWLAGVPSTDGTAITLTAPESSTSVDDWQAIVGALERLDVDPEGRPWGIDRSGRLFVYANNQWIQDTQAPLLSDIGLGGDGSLFAIGTEFDQALGGARVFVRDGNTGAWAARPGRLSAISVTPDGRALGVNSLNWLIASTEEGLPATTGALEPESRTGLTELAENESSEESNGEAISVQAWVGESLELPESLASIQVEPQELEGIEYADLLLNGVPSRFVVYSPEGSEQPNLLLSQGSLFLFDFVPDIQGTGFETAGEMERPVFAFTTVDNEGLLPDESSADALETLLGRDELAELELAAGLNLFATLDLAELPEGPALSTLAGREETQIDLFTINVSPTLFVNVSERDDAADPLFISGERTLEDLQSVYGTELLGQTTLGFNQERIEGLRLGPAIIQTVRWEFTLGSELGVVLKTDLDLPITGSSEIFTAKNVQISVNPQDKTLELEGEIAREGAQTLIDLQALTLNTTEFNGEFELADEGALFAEEGAVLTITGLASLATPREETPRQINYDLELAISETGDSVTPELTLTGGYSLADILGDLVDPIPDVALTQIQVSPAHLAGTVSLYGLPVRAVVYQDEDMTESVVGLSHQELDLISYIPGFKDTPIGSLGLGSVSVFVRPEGAEALIYESRDEIPEALAEVVDREGLDDEELFPLTLQPGVTLVGQYGRSAMEDEGHAAYVMDAYGVDSEKTYLVKANFTADAIANAPYRTYIREGEEAVRSLTAQEVACSVVDAADQADKTGLDLRFALPDFNPPYASAAMGFSNSSFRIREIDGQLEPSILTALTLSLPEAQMGIKELGLGAKIHVQGDLNQLCSELNEESNYSVGFAGSTAFNLETLAETSIAAIEKLTSADEEEVAENEAGEAASDGTEAEVAETADPASGPDNERSEQVADSKLPVEETESLGWTEAFGIPFLDIQQYASSGVFTQRDGEQQIESRIWVASKLGTEQVEALGTLRVKAESAAGEFELDSWSLNVPGPIELQGLPGVGAIAERYPLIDLGDLTVANLELSDSELSGDLSSESRSVEGSVLVAIGGEPESRTVELYAGLNRFNLDMLLKEDLPQGAGKLTLGATALALRTAGEGAVKIGELPEIAADLFDNAVGDLIDEDTELPAVAGISLAGSLNPVDIGSGSDIQNILSGLFASFSLNQPVLALGSVTNPVSESETSSIQPALDLYLPQFGLPGVPLDQFALNDIRVGLSQIEGTSLSLSTVMNLTPPTEVQSVLGNRFTSDAELEFSYQTDGSWSLEGSADTELEWTLPLGLTQLKLSDLAIEIETFGQGSTLEQSQLAIAGNTEFAGVSARAKIGLSQSDSSLGGLIELSALEEGGTLDLVGLINPLNVIPENGVIPDLSSYLDLTAEAILIAQDAESGAITIAAENVTGTFNKDDEGVGENFSGQLAITGWNQGTPTLFLKSDIPITPANFAPPTLYLGPLSSFSLPETILMISSGPVDLDLNDLNSRIYTKVFEDLLGNQERVHPIARNSQLWSSFDSGFRILVRTNLAQTLPAGLSDIAQWFPIDSDVVLGGGVKNEGGLINFGLFSSFEGFSLTVPPGLDTFVESAGGDVTLTLDTVGAGASVVELGIATEGVLNVPRIDTPSSTQRVSGEFGVTARIGTTTTPLSLDITIRDTWRDPLGLEGFELTNTGVSIGPAAGGIHVGINSEEAVFSNKRFLLDMKSVWAGAVPTQLALQFAKSPKQEGALDLNPVIQAELINSIFQMSLRSGSAMADSIRSGLERLPLTIDDRVISSIDTLNSFVRVLGRSADGITSVVRRSPLGFVSLRDPEIFFVTPGDSLPPREGVDRPPLGLGLLARGQLILDVGDLDLEFAEGEYRVNLADGYAVEGSIQAPSPFEANEFSILGKQSLISFTPSALRLTGELDLTSAFLPGSLNVPAQAEGYFDFKRAEFGPEVSVNAGLDLAGGLLKRDVAMTVSGTRVSVYSEPQSCIDIPIKFDGQVDGSNPSAADILGLAELQLPTAQLFSCPKEIFEAFADLATNAVTDPAASKDLMVDVAKLGVGLLPENEVTRLLDDGLEFVDNIPGLEEVPGLSELGGFAEEGLGFATEFATEFAGSVPGAAEVSQVANQIKGQVTGVLSSGLNTALNAIPDPTNLSAESFVNLGGAIFAGISSVGDSLNKVVGGGKNTCNYYWERVWPRVRADGTMFTQVRDIYRNISAETLKASTLYEPMRNAPNQYNKASALIELGNRWNRFAGDARLGEKSGQTYWVQYGGYPAFDWNLLNELSNAQYFGARKFRKGTLAQYFVSIENWINSRTWNLAAPNGDNPNFRCERVFSFQDFMILGWDLGYYDGTWDTGQMNMDNYYSVTNGLQQRYNRYRDVNARARNFLANYQSQKVQHDINYASGMYRAILKSVTDVYARIESQQELDELRPLLEEGALAAKNWFDTTMNVINSTASDISAGNALNDAMQAITALYVKEQQLEFGRFNFDWSNQKEMPTLIFPYGDHCLQSFYRSEDNSNPIFVEPCPDKLKEALEGVSNGVLVSEQEGTAHLEKVYRAAATGQETTFVSSEYNFKLWAAERGYFRLASAVGDKNPLVDYCMGIPFNLLPRGDRTTLEMQPCLNKDRGQLWEKVATAAGPAFFKLRSVETGQCVTWNGITGVDSLSLSNCSEQQTPRQVLSVSWPSLEAENAPRLLAEGTPRTVALINFRDRRCVRVDTPDQYGIRVKALGADPLCGRFNPGQAAERNMAFIPVKISDNQWRLRVPTPGQPECLISTDRRFNFRNIPVANESEGKAIIGVGSCQSPQGLWELEADSLTFSSTQKKFRIRESGGAQRCLVAGTGTVNNPIKLDSCSSVRDEDELFYTVELPGNLSAPAYDYWDRERASVDAQQNNIAGSVENPGPQEQEPSLLAGQLVHLIQGSAAGSYNTVYASQIDEKGNFLFEDVAAGNYLFDFPHNLFNDDNPIEAINPDGSVGWRRLPVTVGRGQSITLAPIQLTGVCRIEGKIAYRYTDGNLTNVENLPVRLIQTDTGELVSETRTLNLGQYSFDNLEANVDYTITLDPALLSDFEPYQMRGQKLATQNSIQVQNCVGKVGANYFEVFGLPDPNKLVVSGSVVHRGFLANSTTPFDSPLKDARITLTAIDSGEVVQQMQTDWRGIFAFTDVPPGEYRLTQQNLPGAYVDGGDTDGGDPNEILISIGPGENSNTNQFYDFFQKTVSGFTQSVAATDFRGRSSRRSEPNMTVRITGTNARGEAIDLTDTTDANGFFEFPGLITGSYLVTRELPSGSREFIYSDLYTYSPSQVKGRVNINPNSTNYERRYEFIHVR